MSLATAASVVVKGVTALQNRRQSLDLINKKKKAELKQLKEQQEMSPAEASAMARLRKGAAQGTIDVGQATSQSAQPLYQQGEAEEAQAMGNITAQGLEGSIIAQETSRKIGSDVRAEIANQARQIAMQNQKTKQDSEAKLQEALFRRGELLRNLAAKRAQVKTSADIAKKETKLGFTRDIMDIVGDKDVLEGISKFLPEDWQK